MKKQLIENAFARCRKEGRAAFVVYITAGDPNYADSLKVADMVAKSGADILELGMPFSDPLADGEANQNSAARALASGINSSKVLDLIKELKELHPELPVVLYTYLNPVAYSGDFAAFCKRAAASGIDALLPLDLPPEESHDYRESIVKSGLGIVSLVAPTTPEGRLDLLASNATSFIYYVSQEGVTGERKEFASGVGKRISLIREHSKLPIVVGFGISTPEHVRKASASGVDGVVVGSAIVRKVESFAKGQTSLEQIGSFVRSLADGLKA
jgi:tryptophan synthase alpha chain